MTEEILIASGVIACLSIALWLSARENARLRTSNHMLASTLVAKIAYDLEDSDEPLQDPNQA